MRDWWADLLIQAGGGLIGTVAAAGILAFAGKAAGLFDAAREFDLRTFFEDIAKVVSALGAVVGILSVLIRFLS